MALQELTINKKKYILLPAKEYAILQQDITDLKRARLQFEANLKALVQAHMSILEQGEKFLPSVHFLQEKAPQNQSHL